MIIEPVQQTLTTTICAAARLVGHMNDGPKADPVAIGADFRQLADGVAGLAPAVLGPRFDTNVLEWPKMWLAGEYQAARYQFVQLVRRLKTARDAAAERIDRAEPIGTWRLRAANMRQSADHTLCDPRKCRNI